MNNIVSFPGLGLEFHFSRVAFSIGAKPIYWYGIIIAAGFILAVIYASRRAPQFQVASDDLSDMAIFCLPVAVICARIYYVLFQWEEYKDNLSEVVAIWHGGLAIYGGVIGSVIFCVIYCRVKKIHPLDMMDIACIGLMMGQSIGRWGNFMNCEAFGSLTTLPWRMCIGQTIAECGAYGNHPTFFYESAWNAIGVLLLHGFSKSRHRKYRGEVMLGYFIWYGLGRLWIEGLRTDSLYLFGTGLRVSQLVALLSLLGGLLVFVCNRKMKFLRPVEKEFNKEQK
ncbi:MAG: prolipoprotein diacylglyceryl transferase [Eubacteriales bacterium]|nr:prolipoprotein diacylglyceryl transferase [Eubacteriales bacterium]